MGFIWVGQRQCAACGAGTPASDRVGDGVGFAVCPDCRGYEARVRQ
ncbi:hypothetical protein [Candidatus Halobonum tyrrellensis]|nr:hypothetical protein [Candidatus Halobonum tyrrellensis]